MEPVCQLSIQRNKTLLQLKIFKNNITISIGFMKPAKLVCYITSIDLNKHIKQYLYFAVYENPIFSQVREL